MGCSKDFKIVGLWVTLKNYLYLLPFNWYDGGIFRKIFKE